MKFVLAKTPRYWWPVTVRIPDPDQPGQLMQQQFKMLFVPKDQEAALDEARMIDAIENLADRVRAERAMLCQVCAGWDEDVVGDDGKPVPFTAENLDLAMRQPWFRSAVNAAYIESLSGQSARLGN